MSDIRIKRGATLALSFAFQNDDGSAFDIFGLTLTSAIRDARDTQVAVLPMVKGATGTATATVLDTSNWPFGLLICDIMLTSASGTIAVSQNFGVYVERGATYAQPLPASYDPVTSP